MKLFVLLNALSLISLVMQSSYEERSRITSDTYLGKGQASYGTALADYYQLATKNQKPCGLDLLFEIWPP